MVHALQVLIVLPALRFLSYAHQAHFKTLLRQLQQLVAKHVQRDCIALQRVSQL